jgi:hypothetical protein
MRRRLVIALLAVLGVAGGLSLRQGPGPGTPLSAESLPSRLSDEAFWHLVSDFSEPNGFFRSDNFLSNEVEYQWVIPTLTSILGVPAAAASPIDDSSAGAGPGSPSGTGGVYLGVGPEQNFTYIVALRPKLAFIVDIRRGNLHLHLLYKAFIEMSADRAEFLSRLFARRRPSELPPSADIEQLMAAYQREEASPELFARNLQAATDWLVKHHSFPLSDEDLDGIEYVYKAFRDGGPDLNYSFPNGGFFRGGNFPTYASLMTETDGQGERRSYLASEDRFQALREIEKNNAIIPVVGNFAGPKALRAVGAYVRQHNATVSAFYTSNVEMYLFQQGDDWKKFYGNVATLPVTETSTFIRSVSNRGLRFQFRNSAPGARASTRLNPIADLIRAYHAGRIDGYYDVIAMSK